MSLLGEARYRAEVEGIITRAQRSCKNPRDIPATVQHALKAAQKAHTRKRIQARMAEERTAHG